jgi:hypothetical protein
MGQRSGMPPDGRCANGGAQPYTAQVLGPYTVNYNTPGVLVYPGIALFAMEVGDWLLDAWVQVETQFAGPTLTSVLVSLASDGTNPADMLGGGIEMTATPESNTLDFELSGGSAGDDTQRQTATRASNAFRRLVPARCREACNVTANVYVDDGSLSAGAAKVWALVARA